MKRLLEELFLIWLRRRLGRLGNNSYLSPFGTYLYANKISIGDNVFMGERAMISASEGISIGNGVTIGPEFIVMGGDHNFRSVGFKISEAKTRGDNRPMVIEDDVWIGARVLVLKGVTIAEGAVVGGGAVVTKNVPPYAVYAGNPACRIGQRFNREYLIQHLRIIGSKYKIENIPDYSQ